MTIKCNCCGKPVSNELPQGSVIRAWIVCPECVQFEAKDQSRQPLADVLNELLKVKLEQK